jgi:hypothetical protein
MYMANVLNDAGSAVVGKCMCTQVLLFKAKDKKGREKAGS